MCPRMRTRDPKSDDKYLSCTILSASGLTSRRVMRIAVVGATSRIGTELAKAARAKGHDVVNLPGRAGEDVLASDAIAEPLLAVDAVVDVVHSPSLEETEASVFYARAAKTLGQAARHAGVRRTVVLSTIGVDAVSAASDSVGTGLDGYYSAKYVHEQATLF